MRSEQIHRALAQGHTRYEICQLVSKGVRVTHIQGARFEDSIGNVLEHLALYKALPRQFSTSSMQLQTTLVIPVA